MSISDKYEATGNGSAALRRLISFAIVGFGLVGLFTALRDSTWVGDVWIHTVMETAATLLAAMVGVLALLRYYTKRENAILFIGTGFLGTACLDGYHALVTSTYFESYIPSELSSLIPWSWIASRLFLSIFLLFSWLAWLREHRLGEAGLVNAPAVYLFSAVFTVTSFLFFAFVPLPQAYYPELFFGRPEEFVPAFFFLLALIGYLYQGDWRHSASAYWLVLALIVSFVSQAVFMSHSKELFDLEFDLAHLLKKVSYVCVLTGLLISMYGVFRQVESRGRRTRAIVDTVPEGILTIDAAGILQTINPGAVKIFGFSPPEIVGRNVKDLIPAAGGDHNLFPGNHGFAGDPKVIDPGREVTGRRRNGSSFPLWLAVGAFEFDTGRQFVCVVRDITERKKVDQLKDEFVSTVSHELRTPLTSITGSLGLIRSGTAGEIPSRVKTMVEIAYNNSDRLVRLINDMLDIEKIQSGKMTFRMEPTDLRAIIEQAIRENAGYANRYGVSVDFRPLASPVRVVADPDRLIQVMTNLLSNAVKHSPSGESILVSVAEEGRTVRVCVCDRGPGIPEEFQDQIFGKFAQADGSDSRQKGGSGLGLSICKAIIESHNGEIGFDTSRERGTQFYFTIDAVPTGNVSSEARAPSSLRRILVCEDEPETANLLIEALHRNGYQTELASNVEDARRKLKTQSFNATILDLGLQDGSGIALIEDIRQDSAIPNLPIVAVSPAAVEAASLREGGDLVVDCFEKPVDTDRLLTLFKETLDSTGSSRPRILHVEDDPDILKFVSVLVGNLAQIFEATTVAAARELLESEYFDLVILDLMLPDGNGEELLALLQRTDGTSIKTVVFSAREIMEDINSDTVTAAFLKSRTSNAALLATIEELIANRRSSVAYEEQIA